MSCILTFLLEVMMALPNKALRLTVRYTEIHLFLAALVNYYCSTACSS